MGVVEAVEAGLSKMFYLPCQYKRRAANPLEVVCMFLKRPKANKSKQEVTKIVFPIRNGRKPTMSILTLKSEKKRNKRSVR